MEADIVADNQIDAKGGDGSAHAENSDESSNPLMAKEMPPSIEDGPDPGTILHLSSVYASKGRFVVRWSGGSDGARFQLQVRQALTADKTWRQVRTVNGHRAFVKKVGKHAVKANAFYLVRVRPVLAGETGPWSNVLVVHTPRKFAAASSHVYSHRGSSYKPWEAHTFKAYDRAVRQGSKYLEQDVVLSKDGTLFVSHDRTTKAVTGKKLRFSNLSDHRIKKLKTKSGERIHTLGSIFARYGKSVTYLVELKEGSKQIAAFLAFAKRHTGNDIIVQSRNLKVLRVIDELCPEISKLFLAYSSKKMRWACASDFVDVVSVRAKLATAKNVRMIKRSDKVASAFTVTKASAIKRMIKRGVDSYFTSNTARAIALEQRLRK